jgi:hypothetical protein
MAAFETRAALHHAVAHLFSVEIERMTAADAAIATWGIPRLSEVLLDVMNADTAVAALFLAEPVADLENRSIPRDKLLKKLRDDIDVWPTWAELVAASRLARALPDDATFVLERDRSAGKHADFSVTFAEGDSIGVEFKAIGLSDAEVDFVKRSEAVIRGLVPARGIVTFHALDMRSELRVSAEKRRKARREAPSHLRHLWPGARGITAAVVVGHGGEENYARRVGLRLQEAFNQLPDTEPAWVAFHWTNGAPMRIVAEALRSIQVPPHIDGVFFLGSVAIPGLINNFVFQLFRPFDYESDNQSEITSDTPEAARRILRRVEQTATIRPSLAYFPTSKGRRELINRTTDQRILPFGLVLDGDPEWVAQYRAPEFDQTRHARESWPATG